MTHKRKKWTPPPRKPALWVVNPNYVRKDLAELHAQIADTVTFKASAELRMNIFDAMPKALREAIHEVGQFGVAARAIYNRRDPFQEIEKAIQRSRERCAICLDTLEAGDLLKDLGL